MKWRTFFIALLTATPAMAQSPSDALMRQHLLDKDIEIRGMQKQIAATLEYARKCRAEPGCFEAVPPEPKKPQGQ